MVVELNPGGRLPWRAWVPALNLSVQGRTPLEAEARALQLAREHGAVLSDSVRVRIRYGTRAERTAAGLSSTAPLAAPNR